MTEIEVTDMREFPRMIRPGVMENMVRVSYRTAKGYRGVVEVPKPIATKEKIGEELRKSVTDVGEMIGSKISVK